MKIYFDIKETYYVPQFLPVFNILSLSSQFEVSFIFHESAENSIEHIERVIESEGIKNYSTLLKSHEVLNFYKEQKPDWIFLGNTSLDCEKYLAFSKTALMQHGIGPKKCYYDVSKIKTTVRFVEGDKRLRRLQRLFPEQEFVNTGFAKLDPIAMKSHLNSGTILYAPTFYPSSLELLPESFPAMFSDYKLIIKPHSFSWKKAKYKKQRKKLDLWSTYDNAEVVREDDINIIPYMDCADILISDASSVIFEFLALNKPVVWTHFFKLRWSYRGPFRSRLNKRLDTDIDFFKESCYECSSPSSLKESVSYLYENPDFKKKERDQIVQDLVGLVDGKCAERIVNYIQEYE